MKIGRRTALPARTVQTRVVGPCEHPLRFGQLPILDLHAHGDDRRLAPFLDGAVVAGLSGNGIEVSTLHLAKARYHLPDASAWSRVDRVLGLTEADDERR